MLIEPELSSVSIVLRGNLNPKIFTPDWFARQGLFTTKQAEAAEIQIIHPQVASFKTGSLAISVQPERFTADLTEAPYVNLPDLVVRTFREFLPHTPVGRMGINRSVHFSVGSQATRDKIARKLAPREPWGEWGPDLDRGEGDKHGGLLSLTVQQRDLADRYKGHIQAMVRPSLRLPGGAGIYIEVNDHYEVEAADDVAGSEAIMAILEANFDESIQRSEWIIDQVMKLR